MESNENVRIKFLKDTRKYKQGEVAILPFKDAHSYFNIGYAMTTDEKTTDEQVDDYFKQQQTKEKKSIEDDFKEVTEKIKEDKEKEVKIEELEIWDIKYDEDGKLISKKLIIVNISTNILNLYKIITIGDEKLDMYYYDKKDGLYKKDAEKIIHEYVQNKTDGIVTIHQLKEIRGQVQRQTYADRDVMINNNLDLVCVGNGILNIKTLELLPFTPIEIFTQKIEWNYNPKSDCPKIKEFLQQVLMVDDVDILQEFVGYCLYRKYFIKKAIIFWGGKNTGKTTIINLIVKFIGQLNTSGVSLHKIIYDKFSGYRLYCKFLNFFDDLSFKDIKDTGSFKIATGGGYISAEKKFGDSFEFMNHAKLLFATNKFSAVVDTDDMAYYDRWIIIPFDTPFDETNELTDKRILDKITTKEEMSGMLTWVLEGLKRVIENETFSYSKTAENNKIIMETNSDSVSSFVYNVLHKEEGDWVATDDLYEMFAHYVSDNNLPKESKDGFSKKLSKKIGYGIAKQKNAVRDGKKLKNVRGWFNVGVSNTYNTFFQTIWRIENIQGKL